MKLLLHFFATSVLCCLSFVAGVLCAGEPAQPQSDQPATLTAESSQDEPQVEAPIDTPEIPPGRPAWAGQKPNYSGTIHTFPVASGPYAREDDAKKALNTALVKATGKYITDQLGAHASQAIRYDAKTIKKRFAKSENIYQDVARYSVGPMHEVFVLLEFGPEFRKELQARHRKVEASQRLEQTGYVAGGSLLTLAAAFVFFRFPCRRATRSAH